MKSENAKPKKPLINTFAKMIVFICLIFGMVLTTVSYVFAYLGIEPLVDLSTVIITTIVSPVLTFLIENAFCDVFQHNKLAFSTPLERLEQEDAMQLSMMNNTEGVEEEVEDGVSDQ